jgi:proteasome lid subunit RPN8/RPN11
MPRKQTTLCSPTGTSQAGTLYIDRDTFDEAVNYARAADKNEVCGFMLVRRHRPDMFAVIKESLHLPRQLVAQGLSQPAPEGESAQMDIEEQYVDDRDVFRLLWHSHGAGSAMFSTTDTGTHENMSETTGFDAVFFMVINTRGHASANIEVYKPFRVGTQLHLVVLEKDDQVDLKPYKQAIEQMCQPFPKPKVRTWGPQGPDTEPDDDDREPFGFGNTVPYYYGG